MRRSVAAGLLVVFTEAACAELRGERDKNLQERHAVALVEGYEAYRTLMDDVDTDVVWFEYRLPPAVSVTSAAETIGKRIAAHDNCFRTLEATEDVTRLRCPDRDGSGFQEYVLGVVPGARMVLVMYASIGGQAEERAYPLTVRDFKQRLLARSRPE